MSVLPPGQKSQKEITPLFVFFLDMVAKQTCFHNPQQPMAEHHSGFGSSLPLGSLKTLLLPLYYMGLWESRV